MSDGLASHHSSTGLRDSRQPPRRNPLTNFILPQPPNLTIRKAYTMRLLKRRNLKTKAKRRNPPGLEKPAGQVRNGNLNRGSKLRRADRLKEFGWDLKLTWASVNGWAGEAMFSNPTFSIAMATITLHHITVQTNIVGA